MGVSLGDVEVENDRTFSFVFGRSREDPGCLCHFEPRAICVPYWFLDVRMSSLVDPVDNAHSAFRTAAHNAYRQQSLLQIEEQRQVVGSIWPSFQATVQKLTPYSHAILSNASKHPPQVRFADPSHF